MKQVVTALALGTLFVGAPVLADAEVGKPAPSFTIKDESGKEHSLAQYKGRVVVLEWTNPECPFVQRHYKADTMVTTLKGFDAKKVVWLAVDSTAHNTPEKSAAWKKEEGFPYPVLQDASGAMGKAYGAKTTPHMYVIDEKGVVRYAGAIDDDPRGKSAKPSNHVKTAVDAVVGGQPVPASTTTPYGCTVKYKT
ncbi:thioredoxin family protein [Comamonas sp. JC664]|uniref:thioredoxin family protein n=1 Tax=Comamonas sp. JC664 TaxID=2801917 RepID=UPI00174AF321|nr:thioredoxin family protein [Comamonas sp. JC664]MBL0698433.1 thioredoxin family protein [Comamonas sp. JC664]GHG90224.1 thioredoxin family protein [Comamonas sp. KCTC 72670]